MLGVLYDVTDRKQMEAELLELNERLEEGSAGPDRGDEGHDRPSAG